VPWAVPEELFRSFFLHEQRLGATPDQQLAQSVTTLGDYSTLFQQAYDTHKMLLDALRGLN
jgi:hypothetical protein